MLKTIPVFYNIALQAFVTCLHLPINLHMIAFPNCKINLGLNILRKRPDHYHDIETLFFPLPLKDIVEIIPSKEPSLEIYGLAVPGDKNENLCLKAYELLKKDFSSLPPVNIYLYKHIPSGGRPWRRVFGCSIHFKAAKRLLSNEYL